MGYLLTDTDFSILLCNGRKEKRGKGVYAPNFRPSAAFAWIVHEENSAWPSFCKKEKQLPGAAKPGDIRWSFSLVGVGSCVRKGLLLLLLLLFLAYLHFPPDALGCG